MADHPVSLGPGSTAPPGDQGTSPSCLFVACILEFLVSAPLAVLLWRIHQPWGGPQEPALVAGLIIVRLGGLAALFGPWLVLAPLIRPRLAVLLTGLASTAPLWLVLVGGLAERRLPALPLGRGGF